MVPKKNVDRPFLIPVANASTGDVYVTTPLHSSTTSIDQEGIKVGLVITCSPQLKELLAKKMGDTPVSQQCLIFAGRILKDEETLEGQGE